MGVLGSESTAKRVYKPLRCTCSGFQSSAMGTSGDRRTMIELLWAGSIQLLGRLSLSRKGKGHGWLELEYELEPSTDKKCTQYQRHKKT